MWKVFRAEHQLGPWPIRVLVLAAFPILAAVYVQGESVPRAKPRPKLIVIQDKLPANPGEARWGTASQPDKDRETVGSTIVIERSLTPVAAGERKDPAQPGSTLTIKRELPPSPKNSPPSTPPLPQPPSFPAIDRSLAGSSAAPAAKSAGNSTSKASGGSRGKSTLSERKSAEAPQVQAQTPPAAAVAVVAAAGSPASTTSIHARTLSSRSPSAPAPGRTANRATDSRPAVDKPAAESPVAEPSIFVAGRKKEEARPAQASESKPATAAEPAESRAFTERRRGANEGPLVRYYPGASDVQQANFVTGGAVPNQFPGGPSNALTGPLAERPAWDAFSGWTIVSLCVVAAFGLALALLAFTVILLTVRLQNAGSQIPSIHVEVAQPTGAGVSVPVPVLQTVEQRRPRRPKRPRRARSPIATPTPSSVTSAAASPAPAPATGRVADFGADILGTGALGAILGASRQASSDNSGEREDSILQQIYEDNLNLQRPNE